MSEPRTAYRTGTEAADIKESALRDLRTAVLQYQEAGGKAKLANFWNEQNSCIIVLEGIRFDEMRGSVQND